MGHEIRGLMAGVALTALALGCSSDDRVGGARPGPGGKADDPTACGPDAQMLELRPAFSAHEFVEPVAAIQVPGSSRWYVAEKRGRIWTFTADAAGEQATPPTLFANLGSRVNASSQEAGLLGIALSPDFATDGRVYLSYTGRSSSSPVDLRSRLTRARTTDGLTLSLATEEVLFSVDQPFRNHNGGHIAFGPDGLLYLGLGDGGSAGDPGNRAQNLRVPLGKLLRLDVAGATGYTIPADNPFADGVGGMRELYAWGLRNPWRFSFDAPSGRLWLGDVGQDHFEEIDLITRGGNYGWRQREGAHCFEPEEDCQTEGLIDPVAEYGRDEGISITGGYVYRGAAIPALTGQYVFGDFGSSRIWTLREQEDGTYARRLVAEAQLGLASFAQASDGELFAIDFVDGGIWRLAPTPCAAPDAGPDDLPDAGGPGAVTFARLWAEVISQRCRPCHTTGSSGGLAMPNEQAGFTALVGRPATSNACVGRTRVVAGAPNVSVLFQKTAGVNQCGGRMPPSGMSEASIDLIEAWIAQGAQR